ncbi:hypothetical protein O6H91_08G108600 [Diphasiastrum complanatum]|uniref:Uncharacterized protein n=1 Tax=Diphasiastrum complanatum TaxID=34168 RepID=A0ACC2D0X2_DIPCM|nr:hypothetical protein O6H91_Y531900 [Diphasiastrum complanatum]KAJ7547896.1 hypothetical protein O6H91_08G108600 [Diphasiastrum complanatum]
MTTNNVEMNTLPREDYVRVDDHFQKTKLDAGALFVLESKGNWVHAGYHLTTSIAGPGILSLPFAFATLGWGAGMFALLLAAAVTFYGYTLLSKVLEEREAKGRRHLRYRELSSDILGHRWGAYVVAPMQFTVCLGAIVFCALLCGQSLQLIYLIYNPNGTLKLYQFIIMATVVIMVLSQLPSFHSLRHLNLLSTILALSYSLCVVCGSIYAGRSKHAPPKDYALVGSSLSKTFNSFNGLAVIGTAYGTSIIPEIQATLVPPVSGKMFKALLLCYSVVLITFISASIAGYWAFGNQSSGNIFQNFAPPNGVQVVPNWLIILAASCVILQLLAIALVYSQPTFEVIEGRMSKVEKGKYGIRNVLPRLVLRSLFLAFGALIAAMLPFFGDLNALIGSAGFIPLDFILPVILYSVVFKPSPKGPIFWINVAIVLIYTPLGIMGCVSAIRQIILDAKTYQLFANV